MKPNNKIPIHLRPNFHGQTARAANVTSLNASKTNLGPCAKLANVGESPRRFRLFFQDGRVLSIPYAHLPVFYWTSEQDLIITVGNQNYTLSGRGLMVLEEFLAEERVMMLAESTSSQDNGQADLYIERIEVSQLLPG